MVSYDDTRGNALPYLSLSPLSTSQQHDFSLSQLIVHFLLVPSAQTQCSLKPFYYPCYLSPAGKEDPAPSSLLTVLHPLFFIPPHSPSPPLLRPRLLLSSLHKLHLLTPTKLYFPQHPAQPSARTTSPSAPKPSHLSSPRLPPNAHWHPSPNKILILPSHLPPPLLPSHQRQRP